MSGLFGARVIAPPFSPGVTPLVSARQELQKCISHISVSNSIGWEKSCRSVEVTRTVSQSEFTKEVKQLDELFAVSTTT